MDGRRRLRGWIAECRLTGPSAEKMTLMGSQRTIASMSNANHSQKFWLLMSIANTKIIGAHSLSSESYLDRRFVRQRLQRGRSKDLPCRRIVRCQPIPGFQRYGHCCAIDQQFP